MTTPYEQIVGPDGTIYVVVPVEPSEQLLRSMALRYNHGLFMPADPDNAFMPRTEEQRTREIEGTLSTMRQLHEEVVGTGFYRPERDAFYDGLK